MNDFLQQWLAARVNAPGALGAGIRLPDGLCVYQNTEEQFLAEKIGNLLHQLAQTQSQFSETNLAPQWSTWVFTQGKVRCVARPDGLLLAIAVRTDTAAAQNLDLLATEFLALHF
jgi:hypothetical protein